MKIEYYQIDFKYYLLGTLKAQLKKKVKLWLSLEPTTVIFAPMIWIFMEIRLNLRSEVKIYRL